MLRLPRRRAQEVFTEIFEHDRWRGRESASGPGSDPEGARRVVAALPSLLAELRVRTLLDVPCGDFNWMRRVPLGPVAYVGADIVPELVRRNQERHGGAGIRFLRLDVATDDLPQADLVLCRDCLVHLPFKAGLAVLRNIRRSGAAYLLATTFVGHRRNRDTWTGNWRALNLERSPFRLPPPRQIIDEGCTDGGGRFSDKSLGLWTVADLGM